jgi:hypothetical protein
VGQDVVCREKFREVRTHCTAEADHGARGRRRHGLCKHGFSRPGAAGSTARSCRSRTWRSTRSARASQPFANAAAASVRPAPAAPPALDLAPRAGPGVAVRRLHGSLPRFWRSWMQTGHRPRRRCDAAGGSGVVMRYLTMRCARSYQSAAHARPGQAQARTASAWKCRRETAGAGPGTRVARRTCAGRAA